ncbi:phosphoribosylformylglycinamidine synthase subunit PurL [Legionella taurinensis]|uniref:Phosphoribosylformylglycinamidine synthase subunit PurL n=1 Tax=Legionella taurinensis TaxID=70611 RepID=A0AB38N5V1_9GAMM|nr:phosphoribosylformylglycinamidine synthase subunit PurL [Legionella taurinensis]MDX1837564.1 phosphoribosylformylglycinamidine synthase subunit PurL [Legionella taurinensis]PUT40896.1 phosphoribosylformylglycinamidine synthase subunit PurL [Legionella taurinensis]PUT41651.1 phosphoribosylformylglycinamidine synthase subunit PurL [Legionella taurinensis]PUT44318.1 phosphoribosylformylglycinamidine synthase subunit PurL [Legionella taurinensis]PUT48759.1 phosphoribosylformylglycinamidine synt
MLKTPDFFDFSQLSRDEAACRLQEFNLRLSVDEALTIQNELLKRPPTYAECVLWSIQGSEHCSYKSSRKHLKHFITDAPHVILGPKEDAGIVAVAADHEGRRYGIVMSHESHNHPSQLVPYEGAATGVGGNVRDVCCMGAEVIAVADSLRFGQRHLPKTRWLEQGVVRGIAGYANPLGIPNLAGDVDYDEGYNENCLVTVVTLGVVREDQVIHSCAPPNADDYHFVLVGKPTDNSGFGGAAFASSNLDSEREEENKGAVQEPNAFLQRHLLKANEAFFTRLRERNLIDRVGFKDLGAGGIACASVELAEAGGYGAEIDLETVPTSMTNLSPAVILCSETQERFMWVVPQSLLSDLLSHYNERFALPEICDGARATVIGRLRQDDRYVVRYQGKNLVDARAKDITQGILYDRPYVSRPVHFSEAHRPASGHLTEDLLRLLAHETIASRAPIYEMYDKQVQGRTILERGCADAGVMAPFNEDKYPEEIQKTGIALAVGQNPRFNKISAYWGAVNAVTEAVRKVVATGAWPCALTDCLCFGNPEKPEQMGDFVQAVKGIADAAGAVKMLDTGAGLPIISGNVSLYNDSSAGAIPPSPMISCLGRMPDYTQALTFDLKQQGSVLYLIGERRQQGGGSVYDALHSCAATDIPQPNLAVLQAELQAVYDAIQRQLVLATHAITRGGLAVAVAEMAFKNNVGVDITPPAATALVPWLFAEEGGFILEVPPQHARSIEQLFKESAVPCVAIGETTASATLTVHSAIHLPLALAREAWENGLREGDCCDKH